MKLGNSRNSGNILIYLPCTCVCVCMYVYEFCIPLWCFFLSGLIYLSLLILSLPFTGIIIKLNTYYLLYEWNSLIFSMVKRNISYLFLCAWRTATDLEYLTYVALVWLYSVGQQSLIEKTTNKQTNNKKPKNSSPHYQKGMHRIMIWPYWGEKKKKRKKEKTV